MAEMIVIGGGIVGSSVAYHLGRAGADVLLYDREDEGQATAAGAGIVSPETSGYDDAWYDLAIDAARYYPALAEAIATDIDDDPGYSRCGKLTVAVDRDERAAFDSTRDQAMDRRRQTGYPDDDALYELAPAEARERFPPLARVDRAFYSDVAGRVDGQQFTAALQTAAREAGVTISDGDVQEIRLDNGAVSGVIADDASTDASAVVVAGGAWSPDFAADLGIQLPVAPQRGQIIHLDLGETDTADWPIVGAFRNHYLVPWPDGRVAAGATREDDTGFDPRTTAAGVREVLDEALRVAPGLADATVAEIRVGLRPITPDGLPVLGPVPDVSGAYLATGHGSTGLTLGPYSGKLVATAVLGGEPATEIGRYGPSRFD